jgi:hypothetical protein
MMDLDLLTKPHLSSLPMSYQPSSFNAPIFLGAFQLGGQQIPVGELRLCFAAAVRLQNTTNLSHHQLIIILPPEMEHTLSSLTSL